MAIHNERVIGEALAKSYEHEKILGTDLSIGMSGLFAYVSAVERGDILAAPAEPAQDGIITAVTPGGSDPAQEISNMVVKLRASKHDFLTDEE